jgi:hypothetical protein
MMSMKYFVIGIVSTPASAASSAIDLSVSQSGRLIEYFRDKAVLASMDPKTHANNLAQEAIDIRNHRSVAGWNEGFPDLVPFGDHMMLPLNKSSIQEISPITKTTLLPSRK